MMRYRLRNLFVILILLLFSGLSAVAVFFSDCQSNQEVHTRVINQILKYQPTSVFIGGDITRNGSRKDEYRAFFETMQPLTDIATLYPAMGNHDRDFQLFLQSFPSVDSLSYYVVDVEGIIWIILNSSLKLSPGSTQFNWYIAQLEKYRDRTTVLIMHHPIYSSGYHGDEKGFSFVFPQVLKKYQVAAQFNGHDHLYERSVKDSTFFVTFGGAGGELYNQEGKNDYSVFFKKTNGFLLFIPQDGIMQVKAIDIEGKEIDAFSFPIKTPAPK